MATYDPQKARGRHKPAADEPAAVDALLDAVDEGRERETKPASPVQPMATAKLAAKVDVRDEPEPEPAAPPPAASVEPEPVPVPPRAIAPMPAEPDRSTGRRLVAIVAALVAFVLLVVLLRRRRARRARS
jgi:hypothetical protein